MITAFKREESGIGVVVSLAESACRSPPGEQQLIWRGPRWVSLVSRSNEWGLNKHDHNYSQKRLAALPFANPWIPPRLAWPGYQETKGRVKMLGPYPSMDPTQVDATLPCPTA
eukprot:SAG22_NODE_710_length_7741_cov_108.460089_5_plen_113_part_00